MKQVRRSINNVFPTLLMAISIVLVASCAKDSGDPSGSDAVDNNRQQSSIPITDKTDKNKLERLSKEISTIAWYNTAMDKIVSFNPQDQSKSFDFSEPNSGWNFSDNSETQWVPAENGGGILFIGPGSFGGNTGSGSVVAGNTALDINYTFCFSASDDAIGLDLVDLGGEEPEFDGISGVIGFAGDFEAIANQEIGDEATIFDYFQGLAYYIVYDNEASGNYNILDYLNDVSEDPNDLANKGFSWVYGFSPEAWSIYFSADGSLNVSGGSMNFDGHYSGVSFNFDNFFNGDESVDSLTFSEVSGYGEMGCN